MEKRARESFSKDDRYAGKNERLGEKAATYI